MLPRTLPGADPSWFGFPLTLREGGADRRRRLQEFLLERRIDTRLLLAGNLVRQPGFQGREHRVAGPLDARRPDHRGLDLGRLLARAQRPTMLDWIVESVGAFLTRDSSTHERAVALDLAVARAM